MCFLCHTENLYYEEEYIYKNLDVIFIKFASLLQDACM